MDEKLKSVGLPNTSLIIKQNASINLQTFKEDLLNEVNKRDNTLNQKDKGIAVLQQKVSENYFDNKQLLSEISVLFPTINSVSVSKQPIAFKDSTKISTVLIFGWNSKLIESDKVTLKNWLKKRLVTNNIEISALEK